MVFLLVFWLLASFAYGVECNSTPTDGCVVTQDTTFSPGTYNLPNGISVISGVITLDCNNAVLQGNGLGTGIKIEGTPVSAGIKNCVIRDFHTGIYAAGMIKSKIHDNKLFNNTYGIYTTFVQGTYKQYYYTMQNQFSDNYFDSNNYGMYMSLGDYNNVTGNTVNNSAERGIELLASDRNRILGNTIANSGNEGIFIDRAVNNVVADNHLYGNDIVYTSTGNNQYCINEVPNHYYDSADGPKSCDCLPVMGDLTVNSNTVLCHGTYNYSLTMYPGTILDCNNAVLDGKGFHGSCINIKYENTISNVEVKNCVVKNWLYGIYAAAMTDSRIHHNQLVNNSIGLYTTYVYGPYGNYYTRSNQIHNNYFDAKSYGMYLKGQFYNNITSNTILNGVNYGILVQGSNGRYVNNTIKYSQKEGIRNEGYDNIIADNDLYASNLAYKYTKGNEYCIDGVPNRYYEGAYGPDKCDCIFPLDQLFINSDTKFCEGTYYMSQSMIVIDNVHLDCNNAVMKGGGIQASGSNINIRNCIMEGSDFPLWLSAQNSVIENNKMINGLFGIMLEGDNNKIINNEIINKTYGMHIYGCSNNTISGNLLFGNYYGFHTELGDDVSRNTFSNNYIVNSINSSFKNNARFNITAENNYWGTNDKEEIAEMIYDHYDNPGLGIVDFEPFLTNVVDLYISEKDILFEKDGDKVKVTAKIHNVGVYAGEVKIDFYHVDANDNIIDQDEKKAVFGGSEIEESVVFKLKKGDYVRVSIENIPDEISYSNNFAKREYSGVYVYVEASTHPFRSRQIFEDYIKHNLKDISYTSNFLTADVWILIGKTNPKIKGYKTLKDFGWGFSDYSKIEVKSYLGKTENPYSGLVGAYGNSSLRIVHIYGNKIEGDIAAVKRFIENNDDFLNLGKPKLTVLDDYDTKSIGIYDFLHLPIYEPEYNENNIEFGNIIKAALYDNMFTIHDVTTDADGVQLRLRNLKPEWSENYISYLNSTGIPIEMPVVLASGIHTNLSSWQGFGGEIATTGRDTWLIEITGGPGQDCDDCPNYTFDDLTDSYVPVLLGEVLQETGKEKLQFVGHSNGCRAVLSTLEKGTFDPDKVETFVGIACPGAFEGNSPGIFTFKSVGEELIDYFNGSSHISGVQLGEKAEELCREKFGLSKPIESVNCLEFSKRYRGEHKISMNLANQYYQWIISNKDEQPGLNLEFDNFQLLYGTLPVFEIIFLYGKSDGLVSKEDIFEIDQNIVAHNKTSEPKHYVGLLGRGMPHSEIANYIPAKRYTTDILNKRGE